MNFTSFASFLMGCQSSDPPPRPSTSASTVTRPQSCHSNPHSPPQLSPPSSWSFAESINDINEGLGDQSLYSHVDPMTHKGVYSMLPPPSHFMTIHPQPQTSQQITLSASPRSRPFHHTARPTVTNIQSALQIDLNDSESPTPKLSLTPTSTPIANQPNSLFLHPQIKNKVDDLCHELLSPLTSSPPPTRHHESTDQPHSTTFFTSLLKSENDGNSITVPTRSTINSNSYYFHPISHSINVKANKVFETDLEIFFLPTFASPPQARIQDLQRCEQPTWSPTLSSSCSSPLNNPAIVTDCPADPPILSSTATSQSEHEFLFSHYHRVFSQSSVSVPSIQQRCSSDMDSDSDHFVFSFSLSDRGDESIDEPPLPPDLPSFETQKQTQKQDLAYRIEYLDENSLPPQLFLQLQEHLLKMPSSVNTPPSTDSLDENQHSTARFDQLPNTSSITNHILTLDALLDQFKATSQPVLPSYSTHHHQTPHVEIDDMATPIPTFSFPDFNDMPLGALIDSTGNSPRMSSYHHQGLGFSDSSSTSSPNTLTPPYYMDDCPSKDDDDYRLTSSSQNSLSSSSDVHLLQADDFLSEHTPPPPPPPDKIHLLNQCFDPTQILSDISDGDESHPNELNPLNLLSSAAMAISAVVAAPNVSVPSLSVVESPASPKKHPSNDWFNNMIDLSSSDDDYDPLPPAKSMSADDQTYESYQVYQNHLQLLGASWTNVSFGDEFDLQPCNTHHGDIDDDLLDATKNDLNNNPTPHSNISIMSSLLPNVFDAMVFFDSTSPTANPITSNQLVDESQVEIHQTANLDVISISTSTSSSAIEGELCVNSLSPPRDAVVTRSPSLSNKAISPQSISTSSSDEITASTAPCCSELSSHKQETVSNSLSENFDDYLDLLHLQSRLSQTTKVSLGETRTAHPIQEVSKDFTQVSTSSGKTSCKHPAPLLSPQSYHRRTSFACELPRKPRPSVLKQLKVSRQSNTQSSDTSTPQVSVQPSQPQHPQASSQIQQPSATQLAQLRTAIDTKMSTLLTQTQHLSSSLESISTLFNTNRFSAKINDLSLLLASCSKSSPLTTSDGRIALHYARGFETSHLEMIVKQYLNLFPPFSKLLAQFIPILSNITQLQDDYTLLGSIVTKYNDFLSQQPPSSDIDSLIAMLRVCHSPINLSTTPLASHYESLCSSIVSNNPQLVQCEMKLKHIFDQLPVETQANITNYFQFQQSHQQFADQYIQHFRKYNLSKFVQGPVTDRNGNTISQLSVDLSHLIFHSSSNPLRTPTLRTTQSSTMYRSLAQPYFLPSFQNDPQALYPTLQSFAIVPQKARINNTNSLFSPSTSIITPNHSSKLSLCTLASPTKANAKEPLWGNNLFEYHPFMPQQQSSQPPIIANSLCKIEYPLQFDLQLAINRILSTLPTSEQFYSLVQDNSPCSRPSQCTIACKQRYCCSSMTLSTLNDHPQLCPDFRSIDRIEIELLKVYPHAQGQRCDYCHLNIDNSDHPGVKLPCGHNTHANSTCTTRTGCNICNKPLLSSPSSFPATRMAIQIQHVDNNEHIILIEIQNWSGNSTHHPIFLWLYPSSRAFLFVKLLAKAFLLNLTLPHLLTNLTKANVACLVDPSNSADSAPTLKQNRLHSYIGKFYSIHHKHPAFQVNLDSTNWIRTLDEFNSIGIDIDWL